MRNQKELNKLYSETHFIIDNADKKELFDYIIKIEIKNKKYKEVIDKIKKEINKIFVDEEIINRALLLGIYEKIYYFLKEVE